MRSRCKRHRSLLSLCLRLPAALRGWGKRRETALLSPYFLGRMYRFDVRREPDPPPPPERPGWERASVTHRCGCDIGQVALPPLSGFISFSTKSLSCSSFLPFFGDLAHETLWGNGGIAVADHAGARGASLTARSGETHELPCESQEQSSSRSCRCAVRSAFGTVPKKPLGICRAPWTALGPRPARSAGHSCKGSSQPWDANAQGFSTEVPDQHQGLFS